MAHGRWSPAAVPAGPARSWHAAVHRRDGGLVPARARSRTSAFVYGNITVLGAVVSADSASTASGRAVLVVVVTALTTFIAHVLADVVSHRIPVPGEGEQDGAGAHLRDAAPIATSGTVPAVVLALGGLGAVPVALAQLLASLVVIVRLALLGLVARRLSGRPASAAALWSGVVLATISVVIAVAKAVLGH